MPSAIPPTLHQFVLFAPDVKGAPRTSLHKQHRQYMRPLIDSGVVKVAGPMIAPESFDSNTTVITQESFQSKDTAFGSIVIYEGESLEAVWKIVKGDIYYTSGVWDHDRLTLLHFVPGTPWPLPL
ncbi:hypothetical protein BDP27DRAFT_410902 [Rhodocollybia butyracea]|uniref:YCII-related domain-containing protein n=1 Tax=Rhodocollybia butyracea TaxID=206335 RepID=A0A9P5U9V7_9AGAR|nr:hypothetical protein BDP27DRAFT_410902 [Rhodocollybia butyracea]